MPQITNILEARFLCHGGGDDDRSLPQSRPVIIVELAKGEMITLSLSAHPSSPACPGSVVSSSVMADLEALALANSEGRPEG